MISSKTITTFWRLRGLTTYLNQAAGSLRLVTTAVDPKQEPGTLRSQWPAPSFSIERMTELLDNDNHEMRKEFRKFLSDPVMKPKYNIPLEEEREVRICCCFLLSVIIVLCIIYNSKGQFQAEATFFKLSSQHRKIWG